MKKQLTLYCISFFLWQIGVISPGFAQNNEKLAPPSGLRCDLLADPHIPFADGFPTNLTLQEAEQNLQPLQLPTIDQQRPSFSWIVNDPKRGVLQTAYQIMIASSEEKLGLGDADVWDSEKVSSDQSTAIQFGGTALKPNTIYYWKVKVWNNQGEESGFSKTASFKTGATLKEHETSRYPLQKTGEYPVDIRKMENDSYFIDFGKDAFGQLFLTLYSEKEFDTLTIHLGEVITDDHRINRDPGGSRRYEAYQLPLLKGLHQYALQLRPDERNTGPKAIQIPDYIGQVLPFRYCEIEGYDQELQTTEVMRHAVHYYFNDEASYFHSSDTTLNAIWEMCKYSMKATSFAGVFVDGDRERIPYEADALINQLGYYCVDSEYSIGRYTQEYLITHPTWPTEWILQSVLMAWNDYLYTGDISSAAHYYDDLQAKTLMTLAGDDGLISTRQGKMTQEVLDAVHFDGKELRDIVDWPHSGILGLGDDDTGETDGFVFTDVNTVVNAYYYYALTVMSRIADGLGKVEESEMYAKEAEDVKQTFNKKLLDRKKGIYVDGVGTDHSSLHANMFPLAFGLVPEKYVESVTSFVQSRGLACSVYGSQFLMDAVYDGGFGDYGLDLLTSTADRSWYNMIRAGSTISMEAWDDKYKPNQDWNHAWGAAPANIIPRKLMGIEPLEPGFKEIRIKPQPGSLKEAELKLPTIRGDIKSSFTNDENGLALQVEIPANTTAQVYLPKGKEIQMNGEVAKAERQGEFMLIRNVGSGSHEFKVTR